MEVKKTLKADLQHKRVLFFEIGIIFSLLAVILAFAWNKTESDEPIFTISNYGQGGPVTEMVPVTREPPKGTTRPQQKVQQSVDIIRIVLDETEIVEEIDFNEFDMDAIFADGTSVGAVGTSGGVAGGGEVFGADHVFDVVEDMPKFMGKDMSSFMPWVQSKLNYPKAAINQNLQGRVFVEFIIDRDGSLTDIKVASGDKILAEEAVRVVKTSPKWTPGKQRAKTVKVKIRIPVDFRLV